MKCELYRTLYDEYRAGTLGAAAHESVRRHLGACLPCRQFFQEAEGLGRLAAGLPALAAPDDFERRVRQRLALDSAGRPHPPRLRWHLGVALAASLLLALGIWLGMQFQQGQPGGPAPDRLSRQAPPAPAEMVIPVEVAGPAEAADQIRFVTRDPATGREVLVEMPATYTIQDLSALEGPYLMEVSH
jgi:hypothetical protein